MGTDNREMEQGRNKKGKVIKRRGPSAKIKKRERGKEERKRGRERELKMTRLVTIFRSHGILAGKLIQISSFILSN